MSTSRLTVALIGNPNAGKTTIFNALTGSRQQVGNYPGVTVEKKEGLVEIDGREIVVVDLPGVYSLTAHSTDEIVSRNFILDEKPDVVVNIVDASNLERNLYLTTQLLELRTPLVLAFNMSDVARARGYSISAGKLSDLLGVPIVRTVGNRRAGLEQVLRSAIEVAAEPQAAVSRQRCPSYGSEIEPHVQELTEAGRRCGLDGLSRWYAIKLLEGDCAARERLGPQAQGLAEQGGRVREHIERIYKDAAEIVLAEGRYGFISGACTEAVRQTVEARHDRSDKIDTVLTHRLLGLPIFALVMFLMFQVTFTLGNPLIDLLDAGKTMLAEWVRTLGGEHDLLIRLAADGIVEGVGSVVSFVPVIAILYLMIALLEDTGYMARAAFVLDGLMHRVGLHGKSFIPMVMGFGCTVPAIMATRILETRRDRLTTMLALPLMSCGARLPVYVLLLAAFFPSRTVLGLVQTADGHFLVEVTNQALVLFGLYFAGIALAVGSMWMFRATLFRGEVTPLVMELPPYRMPTLRGLGVHTWMRTKEYLRKAGTVILAIVVVLWALQSWPGLEESRRQEYDAQRAQVDRQTAMDASQQQAALARIELDEHRERLERSVLGRVGKAIEPVLTPAGFDWRVGTALISSFAAKEAFIGQMGVIFAVGDHGEDSLRDRLAANYTPLQGLCMMIFVLVSSPCIATTVVTARESGSWKWALFQWSYLMVLAWTLTVAVYQLGAFAQRWF